MKPNEATENSKQKPIEVAVGVFQNAEELSRVSAALQRPEIEFQRVSLSDPSSNDDLPEIVYDSTDRVEVDDVNQGMKTGGLIGFSSGLIAGLPAMGTGLGFAAPIAGLLAGAWIGGIAGIDEAHRGEELPNQQDYEAMLKDGKALLIISGDQKEREKVGIEMQELGAEKVYQHPPLHELVRQPNE